ncbi:MAG: hypothetical protein K2P17_07255 [Helicobacteraceae bacterium]|nr:hypothetical protein [Helicobacteraceae bacterium]
MKDNMEYSKLDDLSDTMFKLIEDIGEVEEAVEGNKKEIEELKVLIDTTKEAQVSQNETFQKFISSNNIGELSDSLSKFQTRFTKLESNIQTIISSGILDELSNSLSQKDLLKKEIKKWQMIMLTILIFVTIVSVAFFAFVFKSQITSIAVGIFAIAILPFVVAIFIINENVKKLIVNEKMTLPKTSSRARSNITSQATNRAKQVETKNNNIKITNIDIKSPFDS